jgi:hypothetical protein
MQSVQIEIVSQVAQSTTVPPFLQLLHHYIIPLAKLMAESNIAHRSQRQFGTLRCVN